MSGLVIRVRKEKELKHIIARGGGCLVECAVACYLFFVLVCLFQALGMLGAIEL